MSDESDDELTGKRRDKLIEKKQEWARDGRLLTGKPGDKERDRLPPGQRIVKDWPVLDLGITPELDLEKWLLRIDGAVENRMIWNWNDFNNFINIINSGSHLFFFIFFSFKN